MKISGFSMVKNADKLYYPIKEVILSILPIVDEFVLALGDCDEDDKTPEIVASIDDPKFRIVHTKWDIEKYPRGMENAHQTDIAKEHCSGDWLFYLQADEVVHERYHQHIVEMCEKYLDDKEVEGFLFKYRHFWGDYDHYHTSHGWYPHEIRIVRNDPEIHSWESAQSFRRIPEFDGINYRQQEGTYKLKVVELDAYVYHYGWVRPPHLMRKKSKALDTIHKGEKKVEEMEKQKYYEFDYGPLNYLATFKESHPAVMQEWIQKFDWKDQLQYSGKVPSHRKKHKHERTKYRVISFIEQRLLGGRALGGFRNYVRLGR